MRPGTKRVAPNLYRREMGTYYGQIRVDGVVHEQSFPSLEEAEAWLTKMRAARKPRETRRRKVAYSPEKTVERETLRQVLANAPRTERVVNGRTFTVTRLPDGPVVRERFPSDHGSLYSVAKKYRGTTPDIDKGWT